MSDVIYSVEINSMRCSTIMDNAPNVVISVYWTMTGTDSYGRTANFSAETRVEKTEKFIPYDQLTKDDVVGWVLASKDAFTARTDILAQIEKLVNPSLVELPFPWV